MRLGYSNPKKTMLKVVFPGCVLDDVYSIFPGVPLVYLFWGSDIVGARGCMYIASITIGIYRNM